VSGGGIKEEKFWRLGLLKGGGFWGITLWSVQQKYKILTKMSTELMPNLSFLPLVIPEI